ncbi:metallophosphoesterase family protein [Pseudonocardia endophytica]|uniref:Nuclease SbcCD subunit D n=1 Tax=Pseudonocardia endophytica TaxID=401976 RepID=A0A4R1HNV3_PSEEN|nr:exonuclease subunit SbcD [Pseudonocardia endophytica]TCK22803.1 exodeoxyribonuclease I subunit D [Pseudonocardia endophytica]
MRILHTADWHVGKTLKGRSRLEEQERVLREIVQVARSHEVDVVLVAGDLYDTAAPSAEAQRLVMRALVGLARDGASVVAIAGNHDHARALEAYRPLALAAGITLVGDVRTADKGGVVELTARTGERARLAALPFLSQRYAVTAADLVTQTPDRHTAEYDQQLREILSALTAGFGADTVNLVTAHLTVRGGAWGGGEREAQSILEYAVPATIFPVDAHYVALGHLHRRQRMPAACPVHYSGAPLAVDFGEQENQPVVCVVDVTPTTPAKVTDVPITEGRRLRTVTGTVAELAEMADDVGDALLRVRVREPARAGLRDDVTDLLPNALEVRIDPEFAAPLTVSRPRTGPERHPSELFAEYLTENGIADERVQALFARLHDDVTGSR